MFLTAVTKMDTIRGRFEVKLMKNGGFMAMRPVGFSGKKNASKPFKGADYGPMERWNHSGRMLEPTERAGILVARALEESLLDILVLRHVISSAQREAAFRFREDFQAAGLAARLAGSYSAVRTVFSPFGPWDERTDAEEAAYQRWRKALHAIGLTYSDVVMTVVCYDCLLELNRVPGLRAGLNKLAKWYGISVESLA